MDIMHSRSSSHNDDLRSKLYQPRNYKDMDEWLNCFSCQQWTAVLGAYAAGGFSDVVDYMRRVYAKNLDKWRDKDLHHFFNSRKWSDFKTRTERSHT